MRSVTVHRVPRGRGQFAFGVAAGLLGVVLPFIGLRFVLAESGPFQWSLLALLSALPVGVGIAVVATLNGDMHRLPLVCLLWCLAILLFVFAVIGAVTFGFFLLPSALLGFGAAVAATHDWRTVR
jgi:hypothetical protein